MSEKVIPVRRRGETFRLVGCGLFAALGAVLAIVGLFSASVLQIALGALCAAMFGLMCIQNLRNLRSPGLVLTRSGFRYAGNDVDWAEVEEFRTVGMWGAKTHVKVVFKPGATLIAAVRRSATLGRLGFYSAPAYLPLASFDSRETPLGPTLQNWLWSSRLGRWDDDQNSTN